nr:MAG TPA: cGMP-dependent protein kinase interacting domain protein [Siphoviridae sp. ctngg6]
MYYRVDNTKIIERIKQNEMLDMIADKAYIEHLKSENKRLADENKRLRDVIEHLENEKQTS